MRFDTHIPKPRSQEFFDKISKYTIDVNQGRIWSPTGFELKRLRPDGRVRILNVARSHIIWWKAKGVWPISTVDHIDDVPHHDWINNLQLLTMHQNLLKMQARRALLKASHVSN